MKKIKILTHESYNLENFEEELETMVNDQTENSLFNIDGILYDKQLISCSYSTNYDANVKSTIYSALMIFELSEPTTNKKVGK